MEGFHYALGMAGLGFAVGLLTILLVIFIYTLVSAILVKLVCVIADKEFKWLYAFALAIVIILFRGGSL